MELNKEQIIKALEYCIIEDCQACFFKKYNLDCIEKMCGNALSLIKELTDENENLHASCTELTRKCASLIEENERLRADVAKEFTCVFGTPHKVSDCPITDEITKAKIDTVRKMQAEIEARCIKGGIYPAFVKSTIDKIAEEMLSNGS